MSGGEPDQMRISGLFTAAPESVQGVLIAILTPLLVGSVVAAMMNIRRAEAAIEGHQLTGKVFLVRGELGGDSPETRGRRYIAVMNANGTNSRVLTEKLDRIDGLIWYPKLGSLGVLNSSNNPLKVGWYTLKINGQGAADVSVDKIEPSIPENFRTKFFDPVWEYKDGRATQLSDSRGYTTTITFSPDGSRIAGLVNVLDSASNKVKARICVAPTNGSAPESCNVLVEGCRGQNPVWSPDGTKLVFAGALKEDLTACNLMELYVADADMKNAVQLTHIDGPKMSKDDQVSMVKPGMRVDSWHRSSQPKWSPDQRWIAFVSYAGIYRVRPDGTDLQLIVRDGNYPAWSPDGAMLMYVARPRNPFAIFGRPSDRVFVAHADGSNPTEVTPDDRRPSTYKDLNWAE